MSTAEAQRFLDGLEEFGRPAPILVLTGGDVLRRADILSLLGYARDRGLRVTLSPAVSDALTDEVLRAFVELGISTISISLDGEGRTHDAIRGVAGHWRRTCETIRTAVRCGLRVQVNTCVMRENVVDLPAIFARIRDLGAAAWEVFFLIRVGRGLNVDELPPDGCEAVAHFLYDASRRGMPVRTVEAPFFRRVARQRHAGLPAPADPLYERLAADLEHAGPAIGPAAPPTWGTGDGRGIVFVAHDGTIHPGGFLPIACGNVRTTSLRRAYVGHPLFRALRSPSAFKGRCGRCEYRDLCGGSRARAYARFGDPLEEDPACPYVPRAFAGLPAGSQAPALDSRQGPLVDAGGPGP